MWLAFDVETAKPAPRERSGSHALGITCIGECVWPSRKLVWKPDFDVQTGCYEPAMSAEQVRFFCKYLVDMYEMGYTIVTINGLAFDFRVLAEESRDEAVYSDMQKLALNHFDPTFLVLCERGFPIGMQAMADGFALPGKTGGMDGIKAVQMWGSGARVDQERVLKYVERDAETTYALALKIAEASAIRWITRKGRLNRHATTLRLVHDCLRKAVPDVSWMTGEDRPTRREFANWALSEELIAAEGFRL